MKNNHRIPLFGSKNQESIDKALKIMDGVSRLPLQEKRGNFAKIKEIFSESEKNDEK